MSGLLSIGDAVVNSTLTFPNRITLANMPTGVADKVLVTSNVGVPSYGNVPSGAVLPGSANQILVTDNLGTTVQWSNDINLPGNLQLNSVAGSAGQFVKKSSPTTQTWANIAAADITPGANLSVLTTSAGSAQWIIPQQIKNIAYGTTFSAQDLNAGVGPTAVNFSTTPFMNIATSNTTPIAGITHPSLTQFVINDTDIYQVEFCGFIDPTSTGLGNSIITLSVEIAGVEQSTSCVVCNGGYSFSGIISGLSIAAAQVLRILVRRVIGTGTLNTIASPATLPSFSSTVVIKRLAA